MSTIFSDENAKSKTAEWFTRFRSLIPFKTESKTIQTSFGKTHVLTGGRSDGRPMILLHGALASSAHLMSELRYLADHYRLYAIDIIGQSVMSEDRHLTVNGNDYGHWLMETADLLGIRTFTLTGVSFGGFVSLRAAAVAPDRIDHLILLVPAGLVNGNAVQGISKLALPMFLYRTFKGERNLKRFTDNLLSNPDPEWVQYLADAFLCYRLNFKVPMLAGNDEFRDLKCPVMLITASEDYSFPGKKAEDRGKKIFPNLQYSEVMEGIKHSPPTEDSFRRSIAGKIRNFTG